MPTMAALLTDAVVDHFHAEAYLLPIVQLFAPDKLDRAGGDLQRARGIQGDKLLDELDTQPDQVRL